MNNDYLPTIICVLITIFIFKLLIKSCYKKKKIKKLDKKSSNNYYLESEIKKQSI